MLASAISAKGFDSWTPLTGLAACYTLIQDQLHLFYSGADKGVYEFLGSKASTEIGTEWAALPAKNSFRFKADVPGAPISAVGWNDQARFYQIAQDKLAEGFLSLGTWTDSSIDKTGRAG